jgi:hypothetical protein
MVVGVLLVVVGIAQHYVIKISMVHLATIAAGIGAVLLVIGLVGTFMGKRAA